MSPPAAREISWTDQRIDRCDVRFEPPGLLGFVPRRGGKPMTAGDAGKNPFNYPLDGLGGDLDELMASLNVDQVQEICRYWNWRWKWEAKGLDRWWCSKMLSAAQRELDRRGIDRDSWPD